MPNKREDDANYWRRRQERDKLPSHKQLENPCVLPCEDLAAWQLLVSEYYNHFQPTRPEERAVIDDIIYCEWILRRIYRTEVELNQYIYEYKVRTHPDFPLGQPAAEAYKLFNALEWRAISTRKALREALDELRDLRLHPIPDPIPDPEPETMPVTETNDSPNPEIGFVFETQVVLSDSTQAGAVREDQVAEETGVS